MRIRNMHKSAKAAAAKSIKLNKDKYRGRQASHGFGTVNKRGGREAKEREKKVKKKERQSAARERDVENPPNFVEFCI